MIVEDHIATYGVCSAIVLASRVEISSIEIIKFDEQHPHNNNNKIIQRQWKKRRKRVYSSGPRVFDLHWCKSKSDSIYSIVLQFISLKFFLTCAASSTIRKYAHKQIHLHLDFGQNLTRRKVIKTCAHATKSSNCPGKIICMRWCEWWICVEQFNSDSH